MRDFDEISDHEEAQPLSGHDRLISRRVSKGIYTTHRSMTVVTVCLIVSLLFNVAYFLDIARRASHDQDLSPYARLPRDKPTQYSPNTAFGLGSDSEEQRAIAWESMDTSAGEVSFGKVWANTHGLPRSAPFFWDDSRGIYLLNAHHSLHCMRKVRRSVVLSHHGLPQLDSYNHLVHCMDHLLQNIICEADDTPFYTSDGPGAATGLNQTRMCRSWDRLTEWARRNTACFAYLNETQGVDAVIKRFRYCPRDSPFSGRMREYFGYDDDWFIERPMDIDSLPRYWEGMDT